MASAKSKSKPVTFPGTFRADAVYLIFLGVLSAGGIGIIASIFHSNKAHSLEVVSTLTGVILCLFLVVLSTSVRIDNNGIVERSLAGKHVTPWDQVGAIDKMQGRGIAIKSTAGRNLTMLTLLSGPVQDAISEEAIRRGGLSRVTSEKVVKELRKQGIVEQWKK